MAGSMASLLVSSRLSYVNSVLYGMSLKNIYRLQQIQHSLARVVTHRRSYPLPSATALLKQFHWLPVEWHIWFKVAVMTFKALHTGRPHTSLTNYNTISQPGLCTHQVLSSS